MKKDLLEKLRNDLEFKPASNLAFGEYNFKNDINKYLKYMRSGIITIEPIKINDVGTVLMASFPHNPLHGDISVDDFVNYYFSKKNLGDATLKERRAIAAMDVAINSAYFGVLVHLFDRLYSKENRKVINKFDAESHQDYINKLKICTAIEAKKYFK